MHLEIDKPFWLSRNNLIDLFSVYEFQQKISNVVVRNSNDFQNLKPLDSLILHNTNLIILKSSDYDIYLSLPFPFSKNFTHLNEIIDVAKMFNHKHVMIPERRGERFYGKAIPSLTYQHLGWKAKISLDDGIKRTVKLFIKEYELIENSLKSKEI